MKLLLPWTLSSWLKKKPPIVTSSCLLRNNIFLNCKWTCLIFTIKCVLLCIKPVNVKEWEDNKWLWHKSHIFPKHIGSHDLYSQCFLLDLIMHFHVILSHTFHHLISFLLSRFFFHSAVVSQCLYLFLLFLLFVFLLHSLCNILLILNL